jgi:hypothetical protein
VARAREVGPPRVKKAFTLREYINLNPVAYIVCDDPKAEAKRVCDALNPPVQRDQRAVFTLTPEREAIIRGLAEQGWTLDDDIAEPTP